MISCDQLGVRERRCFVHPLPDSIPPLEIPSSEGIRILLRIVALVIDIVLVMLSAC